MGNEAHIRIDEGITRNAPGTSLAWPKRKPSIAGKLGANFDPTTILDKYLNGEEIAEQAEQLGVHPKALTYHLLKDTIREQWKQAQVAVSLAEYQEARQVIRDASDALSLARAREIVRACQWDLERLEARLFGQKQELSVNVPIVQDVMREIAMLREELGVAGALQHQPQVIDIASDAVQHVDGGGK